MGIGVSGTVLPTEGAMAVGVLQGRVPTASAEKIEKAIGGALRRAMKAGRFKGGAGQAFALLGRPAVFPLVFLLQSPRLVLEIRRHDR